MRVEGNVLLVTADNRSIWPFPIVNGEQTEASKALAAMPVPKPLTPYQQAVADPDIEECLL